MSSTDAEKPARRRRRHENEEADVQAGAATQSSASSAAPQAALPPAQAAVIPPPSQPPAQAVVAASAPPITAAPADSSAPTISGSGLQTAGASNPPLPAPETAVAERPPPIQVDSGLPSRGAGNQQAAVPGTSQPFTLLAAIDDAYQGLRVGEVDQKDLVQSVDDAFDGLVPSSPPTNKKRGDNRNEQSGEFFVQQPRASHFKKVRNSEAQGAQRHFLRAASTVLNRVGDSGGTGSRSRSSFGSRSRLSFLSAWRVTAFDQDALKLDLQKPGDERIFELMMSGEQSRAAAAVALLAVQGFLAGISLLSLFLLGLAAPGASNETDPSMAIEPSLGRLTMVFAEASLAVDCDGFRLHSTSRQLDGLGRHPRARTFS
eukprot:gnl/MRDRNA2_/MRDRNA2_63049_c0_seq1.p1 gnl/MRDRNA2_/MRDRNA2_63049_c0~~gnl/MRDRNA2_/MRDRNA2_63049_c0_seq1.p1  ORF type:complete len:374 (-),score=84.34 gnl/MRDRNA2_/MRDRNA2_63049_c0_seq1:170-1291(-)